ncbi:GntR family transcriptional regulator [Rhizobium halophytocola]|uniref:DNA-binding transcriptional regulator YhcF (GntR family) n=1 Tax=Rhizobium halophytocola TaxID=735519 RepID=A0ABS4DSG2_9HYPH|nr:GntR family transcriptional regulator [Rhizobium halophytocola]MBP1848639.1 DNA-binding transcriptional regulator YhcF (GntR family) [Rhizobium halophytocola]
MEFFVDRDLPVPLKTQLLGLIEYGIAGGDLVAGEMLPSVRELAETIGVAPMTVSQVYAELKAAGLIETRPGAGTFVADSRTARLAGRPDASGLHRQIDAMIDESRALGIRPGELISLISARVYYRESVGPRLRIVMIGLFQQATASYARVIAARLGRDVTVEPVTVAALQRDAEVRALTNSADLAVTFANRQREVTALVPNTRVVTIAFTPSEETRRALASLDSLSRIAIVSRFPEFLPIMKSGVQRFAPHVSDLVGTTVDAADLAEVVKAATVVIYASGAESVLGSLSPAVTSIEYRHAPDVADIERVIVPIVRATGVGMAQDPSKSAAADATTASPDEKV